MQVFVLDSLENLRRRLQVKSEPTSGSGEKRLLPSGTLQNRLPFFPMAPFASAWSPWSRKAGDKTRAFLS